MAVKIRRDDEVIVIAGKDKGKRGKIVKVIRLENRVKVIVEGVNLATKHQKPVPAMNLEGGIIKKEMPIDISNVAIFNPANKKADRVGFRFEDGKKIRFYKSTNELI